MVKYQSPKELSVERSDVKSRFAPALMLLGLVLAGVICRVYFRGIPNFMPVAGMALFAGYFFRSRWQGLLVPLAIMAGSDLFLAGYQWQMRALVYGAMLLPVLLGDLLKKWVPMERRDADENGTPSPRP